MSVQPIEPTADEALWLHEFPRSLAKDWNRLPMRIPARIREHLEQLLAFDTEFRRIDKTGEELMRSLGLDFTPYSNLNGHL